MTKLELFAKGIIKREAYFAPGENPKYPNGTLAWRNNNPGNIIFGDLAKKYGSTTFYHHPVTGHDFAIFPTHEQGFNAMVELLKNACSGKSSIYKPEWTLIQFFTKYSPIRDKNGKVIPNVGYATEVANVIGVPPTTQIKDLINNNEITMSKYHLFGHMDKNFVRKGDKVIKNVTPIGTIGDGNGQYYAHLHFSISEGLTPDQLRAYISGWPKEKVQQYYRDPRVIDFEKMFGKKVDVGNFGYDWLSWVGYGYHPGVDVNGLEGGNTDFGMPFKSSCNGTVIYEWRGWTKNGGWGNLVICAEDENQVPIKEPECTYCCPKHCK